MKKIVAVLAMCSFIVACGTIDQPQFKTGKEVQPPKGCVEGRDRGVKC